DIYVRYIVAKPFIVEGGHRQKHMEMTRHPDDGHVVDLECLRLVGDRQMALEAGVEVPDHAFALVVDLQPGELLVVQPEPEADHGRRSVIRYSPFAIRLPGRTASSGSDASSSSSAS